MVKHTDDERTELERRSKALFDESVEHVPANIRSRLAQARHEAVSEAQPGRANTVRRLWAPAVGLAAAALIAVLVIVPRSGERSLPESFAAADDMAILLNADDLELLEDMEFYAWLDSDPDALDERATPDSDARS